MGITTIYRFKNEGVCRETGLEGATTDAEAIARVEDFGRQGLPLQGGRIEKVTEGDGMMSSVVTIHTFNQGPRKQQSWEIPDADFGAENDWRQK